MAPSGTPTARSALTPPPHPVLVVATSGEEGRLGLFLPGGRLREGPRLDRRSRGRDLFPGAASLLAAADLAPGDLGTVVVDRGPGSFTGVRLGVTLAKTLALATGLRVLAVTSLEALAAAVPEPVPVLALREAGRGTWYGARFAAPDAAGRRAEEVAAARRDAAAWAASAHDAILVGEAVQRFASAADLGGRVPRGVRAHLLGPADLLAALGPALHDAEGVPPHALAPAYLQDSAPERARRGEP